MKKFASIMIVLGIAALLLTACAAKAADPAAKAVEDYLNALVSKDASALSALSCAGWESDALMELDSLQAVTARLEGVSCKTVGSSGTSSDVNCQGNIMATYNGEDQALDLSVRTYVVNQEGGNYLVCGIR
jgi:hypothetical protein